VKGKMDITKLKTMVLSELQPPMNITVVTPDSGLPELSRFVTEKLSKKSLAGLDTETNICGDFYFRKIRTIQLGDKEKQLVIDLLPFAGSSEALSSTQGFYKMHECYKPIFDILEPLLCGNTVLKVGQNLSFEYMVLYWSFGVRLWHLYSTDLAERVIQAGAISLKRMTEFSMQSIVARRFGVLIDKTEQTTFDLSSPLTENQIAYAAFDARMPLSIREHQIKEMTKDQLLSTAQIENDALGAYTDMHLNGMRNNGPRWLKRIAAVEESRKDELKVLDTEFIKHVGRKDEQIDFIEMQRREDIWRKDFEVATPEEMAKAESIRYERDNAKKAGLRAELKALEKIRKGYKAEAKKSYSELSKHWTEVRNSLPDMEGEAYINYDSNQQLLNALRKMKGMSTLKSSADEYLLDYNDRPFIQTLRKYRKGKKDTGTYGKQWTETWVTGPGKKIDKDHKEGWVHPWDGRIHAIFNQLEAETGRSSCQKPNMQNLPGVKEVRECFICDPPDAEEPEGYVIVTTDMSGAELRIIAELANAISWLKAFALGHDVHSVSTEILEPLKWADAEPMCAYFEFDAEGNPKHLKCECKAHKFLRKHTKAINFLLCYGGGADALADDLDITLEAAKELMKKHEKAFPDVWMYLRNSGEKAVRTNEARDLYGRRRLLPKPTTASTIEHMKSKPELAKKLELDEESQTRNIFNFKAANLRNPDKEETYKLTHREPREKEVWHMKLRLEGSISRRGKNHCIQGSNASIIKRAMGCGFDKNGKPYLWHILPQFKAKLLSMVHDELIIQCPKRFGKQVAEAVADAFKRAAAEVMTKVAMESDYNIAEFWQKD
jgi:DNA polymerase I-like protein with 3'-5' exonuclease and polymerase domains